MQTPRSLLSSLFIIFYMFFSFPCRGDEFQLLNSEQIGPLKIGLTEAQVKDKMGGKAHLGPVKKWEADGLYHQKWTFENLGVEIGMVSDTPRSPRTIESISISTPCDFATKRGIRIGSVESDVLRAYKDDIDRETSKPGEMLVAGSLYGGLIFTITSGKVHRIFLGASAE
jgi:hypothetical protein